MAQESDDLEKLLVDVRKTISENRLFLEKLLDETVVEKNEEEGIFEDETSSISPEDEFEEL